MDEIFFPWLRLERRWSNLIGIIGGGEDETAMECESLSSDMIII